MDSYVIDSHMKNDMGMMDWGQYMWIYMLLGGIIFLILVIILLRLLNRNSSQSKESSILVNSVAQKLKVDKNIEIKQPIMFSCPNCKEDLNDRTLKYCPFCGTQLN